MEFIVSVDQNLGIGANNNLLFSFKEDMKHFKNVTTDGVVIMGRKTFESLDSKPLPNRTNIVLTHQTDLKGVTCCSSVQEILDICDRLDKKTFVLGGEKIFKQMLPYCDGGYITFVNETFFSDTVFPDVFKMGFVLDNLLAQGTFMYRGQEIDYKICHVRKV